MLQSRTKRSNKGMGDFDMDLFGFGGLQNRMMKHFGVSIGRDFFDMNDFHDPFSEIQAFSKLHKKAHSSKNDGAFYCQTYVQSSKMGDNGEVVTEKYYDKNYGEHKGGNTISEKQQAYQNNKGLKKLAEERMLNDKGRKVIKTKLPNGEVEENNHYYNIDPEYDFDGEWNKYNRQIGFLDHMQRLTGGTNRDHRMALEYQPPNHRQDRKEREKRPENYNNSRGMRTGETEEPRKLQDDKSNRHQSRTSYTNHGKTGNSKHSDWRNVHQKDRDQKDNGKQTDPKQRKSSYKTPSNRSDYSNNRSYKEQPGYAKKKYDY